MATELPSRSTDTSVPRFEVYSPLVTTGFASATHVGLRRDANEDAYLVEPPLFAVADGMGGAAGGRLAACAAIDALRGRFDPLEPPELPLGPLVQEANAAVLRAKEGQAA